MIRYANWSLPAMGIVSKVIINLQLNITQEPSNLVNQVEAAGKYDGGWGQARNFSAVRLNQLPPSMKLLNSSQEPSENRSNLVTWTILDLAHIEAFSVDRPDGAAADVESRVDIGVGGALPLSISSDWQSPTCFGLNCSGQIYSEDWVPCYTCGTGEPGNTVVLPPCASCMSTGDDSLP
jgi:hypothetical protein